jgi:hypothetical protein
LASCAPIGTRQSTFNRVTTMNNEYLILRMFGSSVIMIRPLAKTEFGPYVAVKFKHQEQLGLAPLLPTMRLELTHRRYRHAIPFTNPCEGN